MVLQSNIVWWIMVDQFNYPWIDRVVCNIKGEVLLSSSYQQPSEGDESRPLRDLGSNKNLATHSPSPSHFPVYLLCDYRCEIPISRYIDLFPLNFSQIISLI